MKDMQQDNGANASPSLWQTTLSVLSAFFGVQSSRNRERDFTRGNPVHFIVIGLGMTGVVVLLFYMAMRFALLAASGN